jgi:ankyrin repeat protein
MSQVEEWEAIVKEDNLPSFEEKLRAISGGALDLEIRIENKFTSSYSTWDSWVDEMVTHEYTTSESFTPLHLASRSNAPKICKWLIDKGAKIDALVTSPEESHCLGVIHLAAVKGHLEIIKILVSVDENIVESILPNGWGALHYAVLNNQKEIIEYLFSLNHPACGANTRVNYSSSRTCAYRGQSSSYTIINNNTPLHFVTSADIAQLLIDHKADVHATAGESELTPLHTAYSGAVAAVLLAAGADPTKLSKTNETPLQYTYKEEVKQLLQNL